ncbi:MAG: hypothetical protein HFH82_06565 [Lachnospiraceae bacterium]|nr:hypothetical protein [Lachnospiraceae bacterium]
MAESTPKRKIRDSVFTNLFQEKKYLLQLYKALHPEDGEATEHEIADVTLKHVLVDADYNDLGFSVGDRLMVLVESQSTWTMNIIIRALMYLMQTYHDYFRRTNQNLYGSKKVKMPKPELYVIFTGERKTIPNIMSLSKDFFHGTRISIDAEIKVLYQENERDIIGQYIIFCKVYQEQRKCYGNTREAVTETIRLCKDRNVLKEYLESREKEVVDIMMTLFDDEQIYKAFENDIKQEAAKNKAIFMIQKGKIAIDEIAEYFPELSEEDRKEIESQVLQQV